MERRFVLPLIAIPAFIVRREWWPAVRRVSLPIGVTVAAMVALQSDGQ